MSIRIKQQDTSDCGAACIASVAAHYKLVMPLSRVRQLASTSRKGTSIAGLLEALKAMGFEAKGVRGDLSSLMNIPKPAIVHIMPRAGMHHYVVVYGASSRHIELMDPADGRIHQYAHDDFLSCWTGVMVVMFPGDKFSAGNQKQSVWIRLWRLARSHRDVFMQALVGSLVFTLIGLSTSIYVQKIVDHVLPDGNRNLLNLMGIVMLVLVVVQAFISVCKGRMILQTGQRIDARLILGYYSHLLRLPQAFFDRMRVGEITSRVGDAMKIRVFVNDVAVNAAVNVFIVVFAFALMFTHYWKLALVMMLALPAYGILYALANQINRRVERVLMERAADLESQLVESLSCVQTIKAFCMADYADRKTEARFVPVLQSVYASGNNSIVIGQTGDFLSKIFTIVLLWGGAGFVLDRSMTPGELLSFYALLEYFSGPVTSLIGMNKTIQNALIASDRLFDIMDLQLEEQGEKAMLTRDQAGDIVFRGVHFRYDACVPVFDNLDLTIAKHSVTAIVGESGCGKSSILSLLHSMYPTQGGTVKIGMHELRYVDLQSLRRLIAIVPQRIELFAGTMIDNIAIGVPDPDLTRVIEVCSLLNMLDFIEKLPQGLYTWVGENGACLSGGQKQRIAIARALYHEPEILALDEATSSLDAHAEQYVHQIVDVMRKRKKTVIIVAHRLSTVMRADNIVVLANGRVAEEGKHETLMALKGAYYRLWMQQFPLAPEVTSILTERLGRLQTVDRLSFPQPVDEEENTSTQAEHTRYPKACADSAE